MGHMACTEPQCLYKGALFIYDLLQVCISACILYVVFNGNFSLVRNFECHVSFLYSLVILLLRLPKSVTGHGEICSVWNCYRLILRM
jgi:hypothetical protein